MEREGLWCVLGARAHKGGYTVSPICDRWVNIEEGKGNSTPWCRYVHFYALLKVREGKSPFTRLSTSTDATKPPVMPDK